MTRLFLFGIVSIVTLVHAVHAERYIHNVKERYFTDVKLYCDHVALNVSKQDVTSMRWVFPNGNLVDTNSYLDARLYRLSGPNDTVNPSNQNLKSYTLQVFNIDDDVFGYYTCLVVYASTSAGSSGSEQKVVAIRWGLNVNGADFSELIDTYKRNAIIGGIAAGVTLVLIAGGCLIWYRCFSDDNNYSDDDTSNEKHPEVGANGIEMHDNIGYVNDKEEARSPSGQDDEISDKDVVRF